jgi:hypothetical protein
MYTEAMGRVKGPMDRILEIPAGNQKSRFGSKALKNDP